MTQATFAKMAEKCERSIGEDEMVSFEDICEKKTWFGRVCEKVKSVDVMKAGTESRKGGGKLVGWVFRSDVDALATSSASNIFGQIGGIFAQEFTKGFVDGVQRGAAKLLPGKSAQSDTGAKILDQMLAAQAARSSIRF
jgi:hypothetical protein